MRGDPQAAHIRGRRKLTRGWNRWRGLDCADDGCSTEVSMVDLEARSVVNKLTLPSKGQIYVTCSWVDHALEVSVDVSTTNDLDLRIPH